MQPACAYVFNAVDRPAELYAVDQVCLFVRVRMRTRVRVRQTSGAGVTRDTARHPFHGTGLRASRPLRRPLYHPAANLALHPHCNRQLPSKVMPCCLAQTLPHLSCWTYLL